MEHIIDINIAFKIDELKKMTTSDIENLKTYEISENWKFVGKIICYLISEKQLSKGEFDLDSYNEIMQELVPISLNFFNCLRLRGYFSPQQLYRRKISNWN